MAFGDEYLADSVISFVIFVKVSHSGSELSTGAMTNHPNQYYMESVNGGITSNTKATPKVKTERACLYEKIE
jgi:hypothetical protein